MDRYCGIDWADDHHDIAVIDDTGTVLAKERVRNDADGFARQLEILADAGDSPEDPIPIAIAIETDRGLWVAALRATDRVVYAINPLSASRYRSQRTVSGAKSDAADAVMLANILRLDADSHRQIPDDTDLARAIKVFARAQQDAVWARTALGNQIRSLLKDYFPTALTAFDGLSGGGITRADARAVLIAAPTPDAAAKLTLVRLRALLRKAGRQRNVDAAAARLREVFRAEQLRQPELVEHAMGIHLQSLVQRLDAACNAVATLTAATTEHFERHPDAKIITSFPGLAAVSGARLLAEIGDDRTRFADARGLKAYAGASPVTRASGKRTVVMHRQIKNNRLASVGSFWTLVAIQSSPGAREHFDRRRTSGDWSRQAQRHLFGKLLGQLHTCLRTRQNYDELRAFPLAPVIAA
ncbi:IS110 family transposase [Rhodococcus tukisamuensis]|uniref:Transposase IS116/IS110/IS902 family protein n=1 Tax=Rhodococcus tukisamuensis TaxID=168276 RepID=A0A1G6MNL5_9NOCA|nr:IS110 family transposase [Rhodococcus tukisamuensis]SDC56807.1 Transposase IS116/IS110/IS902 family protein [Rhodococcus tukisamuensis]